MSSSLFDNRPWLSAYGEAIPHELPLPTKNAIDQFRETAASKPQAPALYYFDTIIPFERIDRMSSSLAAALQSLGVAKGDRVAVYMQNIPQFWIANLAAWKAGAIVVPLNAMFKGKELVYHLNNSGAGMLIAMECLYDEFAKGIIGETGVKQVVTTCELELLEQPNRPSILQTSQKMGFAETLDFMELCNRFNSAADPKVALALEDVALLVYTSGTTGQPKGAMITQANVAFNAEVYRHWMQIGDDDVVLGGAPLFHITGLIAHLAISALAGVPLVLTYRFDAGEILRVIEKWKATFTVMAITAYMALLNHPDANKRDISSFKKAYSGGAPIPEATVAAFKAKTGEYIHAVYGLTETTSPSHAVPCGHVAPLNDEFHVLSVGVPVQNCLSKVVDPDTREELVPGEVGEIAVKGPMVVAGYWQKPEETAKSIQDGWFYTGDVGIVNEQGWFFVIDRTKDMIIASGFKIWPREVEDVLYTHPAVREAGVVGLPDEYRGQTVKGFVALKPGTSVEPGELIQYCKERMANFKYPREIEIVDDIPKTATGKFLRRELRDRSNTSAT